MQRWVRAVAILAVDNIGLMRPMVWYTRAHPLLKNTVEGGQKLECKTGC